MRTRSRKACLVAVATLLAACGNGAGTSDTGTGGDTRGDTGTGDVISMIDSGLEGGAPDAQGPDAVVEDTASDSMQGAEVVTDEGSAEAGDDGLVGETGADEGPAPDAGEGGAPGDAAFDTGLPPIPGCAMMREVCDGKDNNCDGRVDEICPCEVGATQRCYGGDPRQAGVGVCAYGTQTCMAGVEFGAWGPCTGWGGPRPQTCTGMDDFCSGVIDEGCACTPGAMRSCYSGPDGTAGVGLCRAGMQRCVMEAGRSRWSSCEGQVLPEPTRCDGIDRACTGNPSLGCACVLGERTACYTGPSMTRRVGECRDGMQRCMLGPDGLPVLGRCEGETLPMMSNLCDGRDRACTGDPRTGCTCIENETRSCYGGPDGTAGRGICVAGTQRCMRQPGGGTAFGPCMGEVRPMGTNNCDGVDRQCTGMPFSGCACTPGMTQMCYSGSPATRGVGRCRAGTSTCAGTPPAFGACMGEVLPNATEICGNRIDDDCDGMVDENCSCAGDPTCYTGPAATRRRGSCRDGMYPCVTGPSGMGAYDMTMCIGQVLPRPLPMCTPMSDPRADINCDGLPDCATRCLSGWQVFRTPAPICYGQTYAECGFRNEYTFAPPLPPQDDLGWQPVMERQINFGTAPTSPDRPSRLRDRPCTCRNGGDFTFFQTLFNLGESTTRPGQSDALRFSLDIARLNNAVRVTIFNSRAPTGVELNAFDITSARCDMSPVGPVTSRVDPMILADRLAPGINRIVITLLDDCTDTRELTGVDLVLDGRVLDLCTSMPTGM